MERHVENPWSISSETILTDLSVTHEMGLSPDEVRLRLERHGPNLLMEEKKRTFS